MTMIAAITRLEQPTSPLIFCLNPEIGVCIASVNSMSKMTWECPFTDGYRYRERERETHGQSDPKNWCFPD